MGCGASKAAQVVETDITILDHPAVTRSDPPSSPTRSGHSRQRGEGDGIGLVPSDQSRIERAVQEAIARPPGSPGSPLTRPSQQKLTSEEREHLQAEQGSHGNNDPSSGSYPRPVSFEVSLSPDGSISAMKPPPRRLTRLESAPKLTPEILVEKQRVVEERKKKELEKRSSRQRLSKKERLRREIMEARETENQRQQEEIERKQSTSSVSRAKNQAEVVDKQKKREEHAKKVRNKACNLLPTDGEGVSFDASVEMEVDSTYNTDQTTGFWDSKQSSHDNIASKNSNT